MITKSRGKELKKDSKDALYDAFDGDNGNQTNDEKHHPKEQVGQVRVGIVALVPVRVYINFMMVLYPVVQSKKGSHDPSDEVMDLVTVRGAVGIAGVLGGGR